MRKVLFGVAGFATALFAMAVGIVIATIPSERGVDEFELDNS